MTKSFAKECGQFGIRVNALLPGLTKTKFAGALFTNEDIYKRAISAIRWVVMLNLMRWRTVLFLVSSARSYEWRDHRC